MGRGMLTDSMTLGLEAGATHTHAQSTQKFMHTPLSVDVMGQRGPLEGQASPWN